MSRVNRETEDRAQRTAIDSVLVEGGVELNRGTENTQLTDSRKLLVLFVLSEFSVSEQV